MGQLTTHVLDTASGTPAAGLELTLVRLSPHGERFVLVKTTTNSNGRTEEPLLTQENFQAATYELTFAVKAYFHQAKTPVDDPPFLDEVTLRFTVAHADQHYHVPLLVSPWSYSTYRGS